MAQATPFDPANSSVSAVLYTTKASTDRAFAYPYPGTTLTELSPKGKVCKPGTLDIAPTTWP
jgi:hypothetical protein